MAVNLESARSQGLLGGQHDRQGFILHLDGRRGGLGLLECLGSYRGDGIAQTPHPVFAKHRFIRRKSSNAIGALNVVRRDDRHDAGHGPGGNHVYRFDFGMHLGAAHHGHLHRVGQFNVSSEFGRAASLDQRGRTRVRDANHLVAELCPDLSGGVFAANKCPRELHRVDDLAVSGAAAKIARQPFLDLADIGIGVLIQQGLGGHDHAGSAVPALDGAR